MSELKFIQIYRGDPIYQTKQGKYQLHTLKGIEFANKNESLIDFKKRLFKLYKSKNPKLKANPSGF